MLLSFGYFHAVELDNPRKPNLKSCTLSDHGISERTVGRVVLLSKNGVAPAMPAFRQAVVAAKSHCERHYVGTSLTMCCEAFVPRWHLVNGIQWNAYHPAHVLDLQLAVGSASIRLNRVPQILTILNPALLQTSSHCCLVLSFAPNRAIIIRSSAATTGRTFSSDKTFSPSRSLLNPGFIAGRKFSKI